MITPNTLIINQDSLLEPVSDPRLTKTTSQIKNVDFQLIDKNKFIFDIFVLPKELKGMPFDESLYRLKKYKSVVFSNEILISNQSFKLPETPQFINNYSELLFNDDYTEINNLEPTINLTFFNSDLIPATPQYNGFANSTKNSVNFKIFFISKQY